MAAKKKQESRREDIADDWRCRMVGPRGRGRDQGAGPGVSAESLGKIRKMLGHSRSLCGCRKKKKKDGGRRICLAAGKNGMNCIPVKPSITRPQEPGRHPGRKNAAPPPQNVFGRTSGRMKGAGGRRQGKAGRP